MAYCAGAAALATLPDLDQLDAAGLKALIVSQHEQLVSHHHEIEHLKLLIAKRRRMQFGRKSEKLERQIEQVELKLEELESANGSADNESVHAFSAQPASPIASAKPARQPLPEHLPREVKTYAPKEEACTECGGRLRPLGEDVSEVLEYVPARFKVMRYVRPKLSCARCERIVQAPAPSRPSAVATIRENICAASVALCRPMRMRGFIICRRAVASRKQRAGRMFGASFTNCRGRMLRRLPAKP